MVSGVPAADEHVPVIGCCRRSVEGWRSTASQWLAVTTTSWGVEGSGDSGRAGGPPEIWGALVAAHRGP